MRQLPPYARSLDIELAADNLQTSSSGPVLRMPFSDKVMGRPGFLHGGAMSGLLEMAAVAAIYKALDEEAGEKQIRQVNVTIDFMLGGLSQDTFAQGEITRMGKRLANVSARLWQSDKSKIIAQGHMHYLLS